MPVRGRFAAVVAVALLAGCASATSGTGSVRTSSTTPTTSSAAPPSTGAAPSVPVTGFPSSTSASAACAAGADYCDNFSDASSGWPVDNESHYYANYADYLGGSYRMGERTANAKTQLAPLDTTTITKNYGVQIDVDAVLGKAAPASSYLGLVCWDHDSDAGAEAGFLFFVTANSVDVTLLPDTGTTPRTLDRNDGGNFVRPYPATNHITATCVQRRTSTGVEADLALEVNGASVLHEQYAKSVKNYPWAPGPRAGLLVAGPKSDVFYDNFAVTAR